MVNYERGGGWAAKPTDWSRRNVKDEDVAKAFILSRAGKKKERGTSWFGSSLSKKLRCITANQAEFM